MSDPAFKRESWKVVSTVQVNTTCRYFQKKKCRHKKNESKVCSFEKCPIAVEKICMTKCVVATRPFNGEEGVVV